MDKNTQDKGQSFDRVESRIELLEKQLMEKDEDKNQMQVAEKIVLFPVTDQAVTADNKDQEDNHVD